MLHILMVVPNTTNYNLSKWSGLLSTSPCRFQQSHQSGILGLDICKHSFHKVIHIEAVGSRVSYLVQSTLASVLHYADEFLVGQCAILCNRLTIWVHVSVVTAIDQQTSPPSTSNIVNTTSIKWLSRSMPITAFATWARTSMRHNKPTLARFVHIFWQLHWHLLLRLFQPLYTCSEQFPLRSCDQGNLKMSWNLQTIYPSISQLVYHKMAISRANYCKTTSTELNFKTLIIVMA